MNRCQALNDSSRSVCAAPGEAHERAEAILQPLARPSPPATASRELRGGFVGRVGLEDSGVGLHDLAERPERDAVPVREAAALPPVDELGPVVDPGAELREQAGLADAGLAGDRDELDLRLADHALERVLEQTQLAVAADERRRRGRFGVDAEPAASPTRARQVAHRLALALQLEGRQLVVADRLPRRPVRVLVDDEAADRRRALEARGGVDDVAGGDALAGTRLGAELDDCLAGGDGGAHGELESSPAR